MQTSEDVAEALARVVDSLLAGVQSGTIRDINGNTVGSWNLPTAATRVHAGIPGSDTPHFTSHNTRGHPDGRHNQDHQNRMEA